ncbi:hypothetical protein [Streptomyces sp. 351MFTsu5.1]|uniref:hypothetical protein n=1 Tax=Streptomyces sp. 351MFTsu5.1 TaxID=1172180 RepID=UPI0003755682|nr:hypothetical protein [Streptomyces sp. 351MFTsu5.1]
MRVTHSVAAAEDRGREVCAQLWSRPYPLDAHRGRHRREISPTTSRCTPSRDASPGPAEAVVGGEHSLWPHTALAELLPREPTGDAAAVRNVREPRRLSWV